MSTQTRDLLELLRFELKFVEDGGYGRSPRASWRAPYIFEDSPICLNFNSWERKPCSECLLHQLVPSEVRERPVPCRYIPLNAQGETVDSLYRSGTQQETEAALANWLRREIQRLESERTPEGEIERHGSN
jgi:hypothetical protein